MELKQLAIMPLTEAKEFQTQLKEKHNIDITLNHNEASCTRGCTITVELLGKEADIPKIAEVYQSNYKELADGHEVNWEAANSVFDPGAEKAVCPACAFEFEPTSAECPDCGLILG